VLARAGARSRSHRGRLSGLAARRSMAARLSERAARPCESGGAVSPLSARSLLISLVLSLLPHRSHQLLTCSARLRQRLVSPTEPLGPACAVPSSSLRHHFSSPSPHLADLAPHFLRLAAFLPPLHLFHRPPHRHARQDRPASRHWRRRADRQEALAAPRPRLPRRASPFLTSRPDQAVG